jgi:hypothetical protein
MDKEVFLRQEELRHQFRRHAKISSDVTACISTVGVWGSIAAICAVLGGPTDAPMTAGVITTLCIWVLRKMDQ